MKPSSIKTSNARFWKQLGFRNMVGLFLRNLLGVRIRFKSDCENFFQYFCYAEEADKFFKLAQRDKRFYDVWLIISWFNPFAEKKV